MNRTVLIASLTAIAGMIGSSAYAQTAPLPAEVRVADETIPPGGTAQLKFSLTEPRPIMIGTSVAALDTATVGGLFGVSLNSPAGDVFGVARYRDGQFTVNYISPLSAFGTFVDYPILTITTHVREDAIPGYQSSISLGDGSAYSNLFGQSVPFVEPKPGILTVGGSAAIHNVVPGGGTWPAGTRVKVLGIGFTPATKVKTKFLVRSTEFIDANEIDVVLDADTQMDAQPIDIVNADRTRERYYSYLRGVEAVASSNALVASAEPVFPLTGLQHATVAQAPRGINGTAFTALAIQNSNPAPVTVVLTAFSALGPVGQKRVTLNFGEKITRELGEFFGTPLAPGTIVHLNATLPVQLVPFFGDSSTSALKPFVALPF